MQFFWLPLILCHCWKQLVQTYQMPNDWLCHSKAMEEHIKGGDTHDETKPQRTNLKVRKRWNHCLWTMPPWCITGLDLDHTFPTICTVVCFSEYKSSEPIYLLIACMHTSVMGLTETISDAQVTSFSSMWMETVPDSGSNMEMQLLLITWWVTSKDTACSLWAFVWEDRHTSLSIIATITSNSAPDAVSFSLFISIPSQTKALIPKKMSKEHWSMGKPHQGSRVCLVYLISLRVNEPNR